MGEHALIDAVGHSTCDDQSRVTAEKRPRTPALPRVSAWNDAPVKAKKELAITCDFFGEDARHGLVNALETPD